MRTKLEDVLDGVRRIQRIVADLRLFRRDDRQELLPVDPRAALESAVAAAARRFGTPTPGAKGADAPSDIAIPRPPHWGGYRLWADAVELWVQGEARIHDRARWTRTLTPAAGDALATGPWSVTRLQP